jgi:beta-N-acetylhexosaminidase
MGGVAPPISPAMPAKAFITGLAGPRLTRDERLLLGDERPFGLILFARNCREPPEIEDLASGFRDAVSDPSALVLIDQEGGRVQRLRPPHWRDYPPGHVYGLLARNEPEEGERAAFLASRLIAADLAALGITVDCSPILDLAHPGMTEAIGDRALSGDPATVSRLGRAVADGLLAGGVLPVIKHMPGHGRATSDSHAVLPKVDTSRAELEETDFRPFADLADLPIGMTAHVVYAKIDPAKPATTSEIIVQEVIRGLIGFDGLLLSDDIGMGALSGDFSGRAKAAYDAGVDVVLHCSGVMPEMRAVADMAPELAARAGERAAAAIKRRGKAGPFDGEGAWMELMELCRRADWPPVEV